VVIEPELEGARSELLGDDAVIRYWKGGAVGGLGQRALKQSALKAIPHGVRLWWMLGGDLRRVLGVKTALCSKHQEVILL
jgi:hypothetical protein